MPDEVTRDAGLDAVTEMNRMMKSGLDRLQEEMRQRFSRLKELDQDFGWLLDTTALLSSNDQSFDLKEKCISFSEHYDNDVDGVELHQEIIDCRALFKQRVVKTPIELLRRIIEFGGSDVFPNLRVSLVLLLTIAVSVASCERSFSKLKLILTYLQSTMTQNRLNSLAVLSIERDTFDKVGFDEVIDQFSKLKSRQVCI